MKLSFLSEFLRFRPAVLYLFLGGLLAFVPLSAEAGLAATPSLLSGLPNPALTPGALNPNVTPANIQETICLDHFTRTIRPPYAYTEALKRRQIAEYGYADPHVWDYEEDHLIPLSLGGAPANPLNLWPEPHYLPNHWGSYAKDRLEFKLNDLVCSGQLGLRLAQHEIATDWIAAYLHYVGPVPVDTPLPQYAYERRQQAYDGYSGSSSYSYSSYTYPPYSSYSSGNKDKNYKSDYYSDSYSSY